MPDMLYTEYELFAGFRTAHKRAKFFNPLNT